MARIGREGRRYRGCSLIHWRTLWPGSARQAVGSLAGATLGAMTAASLAVAMIGQALAQARGLVTKHAVKQVDRLLSNDGIDVWDSFARWVPHQIGGRRDILVAMDWTDFDHDDQATLVLSLVTGHGRAAPLLWLTVWKEELKNQRNDYEDACLRRLAELVPPGCRVTILADRGFGDQKLFAFLGRLGLWLRHPLPRQHPRHRRRWADQARGRVGGQGRTRPQAARCPRHGQGPTGRRGRLRARQGHEGAVVPGHQPCARPRQPRWSTTTPSAGPSNRSSATPRICSSAWGCRPPASASRCAATGCC